MPNDSRPRRCPECGERFIPTRQHQVYDNPKCRFNAFKKRREQRIRDEALRAAGVKVKS